MNFSHGALTVIRYSGMHQATSTPERRLVRRNFIPPQMKELEASFAKTSEEWEMPREGLALGSGPMRRWG